MIFIGNQTACWAATPNEPFDYALAQGFSAFEWFPDKKPGAGWDESALSRGARQNIRAAAQAAGMRLSVHARWQANPLAPDSAPVLWKDLELATDVGAVLLNVHLFHEQGLAAFVEALTPLIRRTAEAGLQLAIENTPHHSPEEFNELFALLRRVQSADTCHVGMCLDLGHANLCAATRNDFLAFCDRLDPRVPIIHLHLHENWGDADTHLPLFTGPAAANDSGIREFLARLRRRGFSGSVILEQWPRPPVLLDNARNRLLELWQSLGNGPRQEPRAQPAAASAPVQRRDEDETEHQDKGLRQGARSEPAASDSETLAMPGGDFAAVIAAGNQRYRSWREKLDFARGLLPRKDPPLTAEQLIDLAIYLRFLGTGEIACVEDGRHFRPAHHARIAGEIQERLAGLTTAENAWIVRKIYPWLPSSSPTFQRPEPLTRIRDIAHRNDIGPELKREIKSTLQNKLHRCAGPEDLATSAALLERISAPGANYPAAFVEQFRIFHDELKEFFNARSLDERLVALLPFVSSEQAELIRVFRSPRHTEEQAAGAEAAMARPLARLDSLTALRSSLLGTVARQPGTEQQPLLLADIGLEDFAFVLLSEIGNAFEAVKSWPRLVETVVLALKNIALSGVEPQECGALEAELNAWGKISSVADREELLRLKATAMRCRRLAEDFCTRTVALLAGRVEKLGRALGVAPHAIRVFAESDIRGHNVFQLSKLVTSLLRDLRERLGLPGWDVIVTGRAVGRVKAVSSLEELSRESQQEPIPSSASWPASSSCSQGAGIALEHEGDVQREPMVIVLNRAAGDEEIPANAAAIIVAQEIPHLSHLAVRARQAGIVFAACEEAPEFERLKSLNGRKISLAADPEKVSYEIASGPGPVLNELRRRLPRIAAVKPATGKPWIALDEAVPENSGGKASGARRLAELSAQPGSGFSTPAGFVVPFGVMETALQGAPGAEQEYIRLAQALDAVSAPGLAPTPDPGNHGDFTAATRRMRELVGQVEVPDAIAAEAKRRFAPTTRLIVRSSANCEDAEEYAGAGLHESVIGVPPSDITSAIRTVWASLWTERATLSRRNAGIPHARAHMAVLIQELVVPELSFVLHTVNPISQNHAEVYAEVVVGLGETLVSAASLGSPYRLVCDKRSKPSRVTTLAFANFSQASWPGTDHGVRRETVDYSRIDLSRVAEARAKLGQRLAAIAWVIEQAMERPQDIEGVVVKGEIFLVQSRPQTGLSH